jgi:hypothetical protein
MTRETPPIEPNPALALRVDARFQDRRWLED